MVFFVQLYLPSFANISLPFTSNTHHLDESNVFLPGANNFTRQHVPAFLSSLSALKAVCIGSANLYGTLPSFHDNVVNTLVQLRLDNNALSGRYHSSITRYVNTTPCSTTN